MARQLRITDPGLWHHVMNRGTDHGVIFLCDDDRHDLVRLIAELGPRFAVWPVAYAFADNHFHIEIVDDEGRLSEALRHLGGVYTQRFNRRHERDGPLFRGRFRSRVIGDAQYVTRVGRYVHSHAPGDGSAESLAAYEWSSHRFYVRDEPPAWLASERLLRFFGGVDEAARRAFEEFVVHGSADLPEESWYRGEASIIGDDEFVEECRGRIHDRAATRANPNVPEGRRLAAPTIDEVIHAAARYLRRSPARLLRRTRRAADVAIRRRAMWACAELSGATQTAIAARFGVVPTTVWRACATASEAPGAQRFLEEVSRELGREDVADRAAE